MGEQKPLVRNVGDPKQVKNAKKQERLRDRQRIDDIRFLTQQPAFKRWLWEHLDWAKVFQSIWVGSAEIHRLAGRQEFGCIMLEEIAQVNPDFACSMLKEFKWKVDLEEEEEKQKGEVNHDD